MSANRLGPLWEWENESTEFGDAPQATPIPVDISASHELRALSVGFWTVSPARTSSGYDENSFRYWHLTLPHGESPKSRVGPVSGNPT